MHHFKNFCNLKNKKVLEKVMDICIKPYIQITRAETINCDESII